MAKKKIAKRYVLDAGALLGFERHNPKIGALIKAAPDLQVTMIVPSGVLAQVWRNGARQALLSKALRDPVVVEAPLNHDDAKRIGELLRVSGSSDVIDAHVAVLAGRLQAPVITSDSGDIAKLDPGLDLIRV
jgi:hypothetical protein